MAFFTEIQGHHHLQGSGTVQVYNVRIPVYKLLPFRFLFLSLSLSLCLRGFPFRVKRKSDDLSP